MTEKLLPCPFCGSDHIFLNGPSPYPSKGSINCAACLAYIPAELDEIELVKTWNTRVADAPETLTVDVMMRCQHQQMRDAINDVELALNGLEIDSVVRLLETADDSVMVKVPLGTLRQLGRCYPDLNRIINDPAFERKS
jgi:Lar family restriction alleviation protein